MNKPTAIPLDDGSGWVTAYVAKGEHTEDAMRDAVRRHCGYDERDPVDFVFIETRHFRWIPEPPGSGAGYDQRLERSEPGRGAFLATYVELR